jgi:Uncharacterised nucleotidyltransferase
LAISRASAQLGISRILSRLTPSLTSYPAELGWVLGRSFGPVETALPRPRPAQTLELARRLDLDCRIGARTPHDALERELGPDAARVIAFQRLRLLAENRELAEVVRQVSEVARLLGMRPLWLKFAALTARGFVSSGMREARDVDLLLPETEGNQLFAALLRRDFKPIGQPSTPHQLPTLCAPSGAAVEVHRFVWGLQLAPNRASATFEDFIANDAVVPLPDGSLAPRDDLLIAHALVHAMVQHRTTPAAYTAFRVLADLIDLKAWKTPSSQVQAAVATHLTEAEINCAFSLARALEVGDALAHLPDLEAKLLQGLLAASLDPDFQSALGLERIGELLHERRLLGAVWRALVTSLARGDEARQAGDLTAGARASQLARSCAAYARLAWRSSQLRR